MSKFKKYEKVAFNSKESRCRGTGIICAQNEKVGYYQVASSGENNNWGADVMVWCSDKEVWRIK